MFILCVIGCSKMDGVFDGTDKNVISPVSLNSVSGKDVFSYAESSAIVPGLLKSNGISLADGPLSGNKPYAGAIVINDRSVIDKLVNECQLASRLPDCDFTACSLVAGYFDCAQGGYSIVNQRVKKALKGTKLYLDIEETSAGICSPCRCYLLALYPGLPDGPVEVIRSDI